MRVNGVPGIHQFNVFEENRPPFYLFYLTAATIYSGMPVSICKQAYTIKQEENLL